MIPFTKAHFNTDLQGSLIITAVDVNAALSLLFALLFLVLTLTSHPLSPVPFLCTHFLFSLFSGIMVGYLIWDTVVLYHPGCLEDIAAGLRDLTSPECQARERKYTTMESADTVFEALTTLIQFSLFVIGVRATHQQRVEQQESKIGRQIP
jgi:hypothetical protein